MSVMDPKSLTDLVRRALDEDIRTGDVTTRALARPQDRVAGAITAQAPGVVAGLPAAREVFRQLDDRVRVTAARKDGSVVRPGDVLLRLRGPAAPILIGERTALNFLGLLSGIATQTARYVRAVAGTRARIFDTRKTPPGLRLLAKYAVRQGGGCNHRSGLYDGILIKDNHIRLAGSVRAALERARRANRRNVPVEIEAETLGQVREAVEGGADIILLDNLRGSALRQAVRLARGHAELEVSGGMDPVAVKAAARLGVDRISVGALTHSAPWLAMHLELD